MKSKQSTSQYACIFNLLACVNIRWSTISVLYETFNLNEEELCSLIVCYFVRWNTRVSKDRSKKTLHIKIDLKLPPTAKTLPSIVSKTIRDIAYFQTQISNLQKLHNIMFLRLQVVRSNLNF